MGRSIKRKRHEATELITFTPPTGIEVKSKMTTQVLIITMGGLGIIVAGIVVIKKKVLKNK